MPGAPPRSAPGAGIYSPYRHIILTLIEPAKSLCLLLNSADLAEK
jgi:hypothetical protein